MTQLLYQQCYLSTLDKQSFETRKVSIPMHLLGEGKEIQTHREFEAMREATPL